MALMIKLSQTKIMPSVAVISVNTNNYKDVIEMAKSVEKISYPNYKLFIVDNGSTDGSLEQFRNAGLYGFTRIIENGRNLGFSGANNVGMKIALEEGFDYCLLLNDDTVVEPDFLDKMIELAESDKKIGAVGPKILYFYDKNSIWFGGGGFSWTKGSWHFNFQAKDSLNRNEPAKDISFLTGCAFLIKSKVIKEIGFLYEPFFLYFEDTDWSLRIKKAGYRLVYEPKARIYHKVSRTTSKFGSPKVIYYHVRNWLLLAKRNASFPILIMIYSLSWARYAKQILKLIVIRDPLTREISKMIMKGIEDFYADRFYKLQEIEV